MLTLLTSEQLPTLSRGSLKTQCVKTYLRYSNKLFSQVAEKDHENTPLKQFFSV